MEFECPFCGSKKAPIVIRFFQPRLFKCIHCKKNSLDREFYLKRLKKERAEMLKDNEKNRLKNQNILTN